jgi:hypothetical protein
VAGARVEVLDGPLAGTATTTNESGSFSIAGSFDDSVRFRVSKPGYIAKTQTSRIPDCATCERYVGFLMELEAVPVDLTGNYILSFTAAPACAGIPEDARTRTYNATITRDRTLAWSFDVAITSGSILHGHASEYVKFGVAGNDVTFSVGDLHGSPGLVEQLTAETYVGFDGSARGSVAPSFSSLSLPFDGLVDYCRLPSGSPAPVGSDNYYACTAGRVPCVSQGHRVTLSRR